MWLRDTGILEKLKYDIVRPPFHIPLPKVRRDQPLIISQLGIVLIVLAVGLGLSIPMFLSELMKGRGKKAMNELEERKHLTLMEVEHLTLPHYGRSLEECLA